MARKRTLINKKYKKLYEKVCYICGEDDYDLLDVHRIIPGEEGGKYTEHNSLVMCANCHRKSHSGRIKMDRKYQSTTGRTVLHYWEDGEEKWK
jgi:hypothetical protein